ncbi:MAG: AAA family ATPase [Pseudomonadota bacterium]
MTELIGNAAARAEFAGVAAGSALHHAWLIAGPQGVGKASFARAMAAQLLGTTVDNAMIAAGSHPDYRELKRLPKDTEKPDQDLARSIPIAQIRGLLPMFATRPTYSERRVIVIDAIDDVERPGASNALLKSLEEPPAGTIFLLVSHAPSRLLPTIRSRCRVLRFAGLADDEVAQVIARAMPTAGEAEVAALVAVAGGSPGRALGFAGLDLAGIDRALGAIAQSGDPSNAARSALAKALGGKAAQLRYELFLERAPRFIADRARQSAGGALKQALDLYDAARSLAGSARGLSLDPQATVYEMAGLVAALPRG